MHLIMLGLLVVFGGLTIFLQDRTFIMWKPSIVNWLFAAVFLGSHFIGERPLIARLIGQAVNLPHHVWHRLNSDTCRYRVGHHRIVYRIYEDRPVFYCLPFLDDWIPGFHPERRGKGCNSPLAGCPLMRFALGVGVVLRRRTTLTTSYIPELPAGMTR